MTVQKQFVPEGKTSKKQQRELSGFSNDIQQRGLSHANALMRRAQNHPQTLSPKDIAYLQRTVGNARLSQLADGAKSNTKSPKIKPSQTASATAHDLQNIIQRTILKEVKLTNVFDAIESREIADQKELDRAANTYEKLTNMKTAVLHTDSPVQPEEPVYIVAHGSAKGGFTQYSPKVLARILVEEHQIQPGMSIVLEGCYSGKGPGETLSESYTARLGDEIDHYFALKAAEQTDVADAGEQKMAKTNVSAQSSVEELSQNNAGKEPIKAKEKIKKTLVAGNPGVIIDYGDQLWGITKKDNDSQQVYMYFKADLEELEKGSIEQFRKDIAPLNKIEKAAALKLMKTLGKYRNDKELGNIAMKHGYPVNEKFRNIDLTALNDLFDAIGQSRSLKVWHDFIRAVSSLPADSIVDTPLATVRASLQKSHTGYLEEIDSRLEQFMKELIPYSDEYPYRKKN